MGWELINNGFIIVDPSSTFGVTTISLTVLVGLGTLVHLFWLLFRNPYKRQLRIQRIMIYICILNLICIPFAILNAFTDASRITAGIADWSGNFLVLNLYMLELEILLVFEPLSTIITHQRVKAMQVFIALLHIFSFLPGYCAIILVLSGVVQMPSWIRFWYTPLYSAGIAIAIICNVTQSIYVTKLLYHFIQKKKRHSDLTDEELIQINFSRKLVIQYLNWVLIISSLDIVTIGIFYFQSGNYESGFTCSFFLTGRVLEVFIAYHYVIQIPFKTASSSAGPSFGILGRKITAEGRKVLATVRVKKSNVTSPTASSLKHPQHPEQPHQAAAQQQAQAFPGEKDTIMMERPAAAVEAVSPSPSLPSVQQE